MHKSTHRKKNGALPIKPLLLAVLLSVGEATVLMLLFSLFLYLEWLPEDAIPVGNAIVKVLSAALAGLWIGRSVQDRAWLWGGIAGLLFSVLTALLFSLLLGSFRLSITTVSDALFAFVIGAAVAALLAWRKREKKA